MAWKVAKNIDNFCVWQAVTWNFGHFMIPINNLMRETPMPKKALEIFSQQIQSGKLHHGWILENPFRVEIKSFIQNILNILVSSDVEHLESHPNIFYLSSKKDLNVADIRKAIDFSYQTSWNGGWKIVIVEEAERMNPQSQNALLKVFEEPPEKTFFLMVTHHQNALLSTLYSRAFVYGVQPMDYVSAQEHIVKNYPTLSKEEQHLLQIFSGGSGSVVDQLMKVGFLEIYQTFLTIVANSMQDASQLYKLRQCIPEVLQELEEKILLTTFHRFTQYLSNVEIKISSHEKESFDRMAARISLDSVPEAWHRASSYIQKVRFYNLPTTDMGLKLCYLLFIEKTENLLSKEPV